MPSHQLFQTAVRPFCFQHDDILSRTLRSYLKQVSGLASWLPVLPPVFQSFCPGYHDQMHFPKHTPASWHSPQMWCKTPRLVWLQGDPRHHSNVSNPGRTPEPQPGFPLPHPPRLFLPLSATTLKSDSETSSRSRLSISRHTSVPKISHCTIRI